MHTSTRQNPEWSALWSSTQPLGDDSASTAIFTFRIKRSRDKAHLYIKMEDRFKPEQEDHKTPNLKCDGGQ